jgi:valyl-tRNA synthetase
MGKMTVAEAAQHFNVSKEAIHNRIRRGTLDCVIENGIKYVAVGENKAAPSDDRYYSYIEKENERLKAKVDTLEHETRRLREQREQMLIDERKKVEQIYKERDEQLKNVLQVVASKFLTQTNVDSVIEEAAVTAEVVVPDDTKDLVSLKEFMKLKQFGKKKREKLKERFKKIASSDERIFDHNGKLHLKPNHFDYSDLLKV